MSQLCSYFMGALSHNQKQMRRKRSKFPLSSRSATTVLHLDELRAAFLDNGLSNDKIDGWYLDSGATHHMTGW